MRLAFAARALFACTTLCGGASTAALEVSFLRPADRQPVFGSVEVWIEAGGPDDEVSAVELWVDGRQAGRLEAPPYRFTVDVGEENRSHVFEARAFARGGERQTATLETTAILIHDAVELQLQQVYFSVSARNGERVLDLPAEIFSLFDEERPVKLVTFAHGDIPLAATLLIDGSASMRGARAAAARAGVREFIDGMLPHDEVSILAFADQLLTDTPFTLDAEALLASLDGLETQRGTALHDYLFLALRRLEERQGRRVVVVLSDGEEIHSVLSIEQVQRVVRRSQAQIYWVRLGAADPHGRVESWHNASRRREQMRKLENAIKESGGRVVQAERARDIEPAFREILADLRAQYAIGFYPHDLHHDGSWRSLRLEMDRSGLRVRARNGYIDY